MKELLPFIKWLKSFLLEDWKNRFFSLLGISIIAIGYLGNSLFWNLENNNLKTENNDLRSKLEVLGSNTEQYALLLKNATDFKRDWDTSNFYIIEGDIFCPKKKGEDWKKR